MYKKVGHILSLMTVVLISSVSFVYAQEIPQSSQTTEIREIKARYCNDPERSDVKSLFIDAKVDEKEVICIDFINTSNKVANIGINFVDGTVTNDESQNKACLPEHEKTNFGQYVSNYPNTITIKPKSAQRIFVDLLYSGGFAGTSYGCLTFHALNTTGTNNMFNVFSRVGSFIDVFVEGDFIIKLISTPINSEFYNNIGKNENFYLYRASEGATLFDKDFWTYKARWNITNTGNIAVTGQVTIAWNNWFLFQGERIIQDQVFVPQQTRSFEATLPRYIVWILGGPTRIEGSVAYEAIYLGSYAEQAPEETFMLEDHTSYFFGPWLIMLGILYGIKRLIDQHKQHESLISLFKNTINKRKRFTKRLYK